MIEDMQQRETVAFDDVLPVLLEAFRDFVRVQQGGTFRIHARKFGSFIRDGIRFPAAGASPRYIQLAKDADFMDGNDHLAGLALSRLAEAENSVIVPVEDAKGESLTRAGVGFIYEFSPGGQIDGPDAVPLSRVKPPRVAIRYVGDITRMMGSIKNEGQHVQIVVRPCAEKGFDYEVVDGFTRFRSIDCLGYLHKVRVVVEELSDAEAVKRALTLNMVRYQMNDLEQAKTFSMIIENRWATVKSLAASIGYSEDYVRTRLQLVEAPPEIQERVARRDISMERALAFSKLVREEKVGRSQATELIDRSNEMGLSQRQLIEATEEVSKGVPVDQATSKVLERDNRKFLRKERMRTVIAVRTSLPETSFVPPPNREITIDWASGEVFYQSTLEVF